jgi:polar amino acid transport system ATP-binding protein
MLIVTHDMAMARDVADHVVFLHNGVIEEQGSPSAIFGIPKSQRLQQFLAAVS